MAGGELQDRIAFVTGGSSGIGAACVAVLAEAGADVCVGYHKEAEEAAEEVRAVTERGRRAFAVKLNVADETEVEAAFDRCRNELGVADILVNSAGLNESDVAVADMTLKQWRTLLDVDLTGSFLTCRRFVRDLKGTGRPGAIINITSIHAFAMRAGAADYTAAKGGQENLTRTLALEVAVDGITVNAIAPGMILTPMNSRAMEDPEHRRALEQGVPARRAGTAEEVARLAAFLASPHAAYITGASITIDGGLSLLIGQGA